MKSLGSVILVLVCVYGASAFASYQRIAFCAGRSDKSRETNATLFVNQKNNSVGIIVVNVQAVGMTISDTKVDWEAHPQGFPRFYDNDFDLDIVINDATSSVDDILVDDNYVGALTCFYNP